MVEILQQLFVALISVLFARWLDKAWPSTKSSEQILKIQSEINITGRVKTLSEQINERVFLSNWTYYILTTGWLYCFLAASGCYLYSRSTFLQHPIQENLLTRILFEYIQSGVSPISVIVTFLLYPIINFISSRIFRLIIYILASWNVSLTRINIQQFRMGICMGLSIILAVFLAWYLS